MTGNVLAMFSVVAIIVLWAWTVYHLVILAVGWPHSKRSLGVHFHVEALRNPVDLPSFSIIIAAKNEENVIKTTLENIVRLRYPRHLLQVIVTEDGSSDKTRELCEEFARTHEEVLFLHGEVSWGKADALNRAMRLAKGQILLFLDADTVFECDLLLKAAKFFHDRADIGVAQALIDTCTDRWNLIAKLDRFETLLWYRGIIAGKDRLGLFVPLCGTGMFIRRRVLDKAGKWNVESLAEDIDMSVRLSAAGESIRVLPVRVWRQPPYSVSDFVNQRKRWWGGALQVLPRGLRPWRNQKLPWKRRVDMLTQLGAPFVFVMGTIYLLLAVSFSSIRMSQPEIVLATLSGIATSQIILLAMVLLHSVASRSIRNLNLIPGIYIYWALQLFAVMTVLIGLASGRPPHWKVTTKRQNRSSEYGSCGSERVKQSRLLESETTEGVAATQRTEDSK